MSLAAGEACGGLQVPGGPLLARPIRDGRAYRVSVVRALRIGEPWQLPRRMASQELVGLRGAPRLLRVGQGCGWMVRQGLEQRCRWLGHKAQPELLSTGLLPVPVVKRFQPGSGFR